MRVLVVKTSSLGDVVHTLPALTDAQRAIPHIRFDWLVEDAFTEIPRWHPAVDEVIPVGLRRWRKHPWATWRSGVWSHFVISLRRHYYDHIIDAQGLLKSAFLTRYAKGVRSGLDKDSAREPLAAWFYQHRYHIPKDWHAIERVRQLFAAALDYSCPQTPPDYGIQRYTLTTVMVSQPTLLFFHGTTWPSKHWPEAYWSELALLAADAGFHVRLPWGNETERERAHRIAATHHQIQVVPPANLYELAAQISTANAVVGVDTGLVHLAAALGIPSITLYGSTDPGLTGTLGPRQIHLRATFPCAPCLRKTCDYQGDAAVTPACYVALTPPRVWRELTELCLPDESKK